MSASKRLLQRWVNLFWQQIYVRFVCVSKTFVCLVFTVYDITSVLQLHIIVIVTLFVAILNSWLNRLHFKCCALNSMAEYMHDRARSILGHALESDLCRTQKLQVCFKHKEMYKVLISVGGRLILPTPLSFQMKRYYITQKSRCVRYYLAFVKLSNNTNISCNIIVNQLLINETYLEVVTKYLYIVAKIYLGVMFTFDYR